MSFQVCPVDDAVDWPELGRCLHTSYTLPTPEPMFRFFRPVFDDSPEGIARVIERGTAALKSMHESATNSLWYKVVDNDTGRIIAGACFRIFHGKPFDHEEEKVHAAWPVGGQRDFVTAAGRIKEAPHKTLFNRPHVFVNVIFTHPDYRKKGMAGLLLEKGISKARDLNYPMWLDSFPLARRTYESYGFHTASSGEIDIQPSRPNGVDPDEWKRAENYLLPLKFWPMWRPADGPYVEELILIASRSR